MLYNPHFQINNAENAMKACVTFSSEDFQLGLITLSSSSTWYYPVRIILSNLL